MGMTPVHVNIASDETEGRSTHFSVSPCPPGFHPAHEIPAEQAQALGASKHKLTSNVFHRGMKITLHGHDVGPGVDDEAPPILGKANGYLPIISANSSRKVMFGASTVNANATPLGAAESANFPMLTCGQPLSSPTVFPTTNTLNTVLVGLTASDVVEGWEDIADAMVVDAVCFVVSFGGDLKGILDALGLVGFDPVKSGLSSILGLKRSIERSIASGGTRPVSFKIDGSGAGGGGGVELKWTPATGEAEVGGEVGFYGSKETAGAKRDKDGNWKGTGVIPPDLFE